MSNGDTPVLAGWPIAWPPGEGFMLQGDVPAPHKGQGDPDNNNAPGGLVVGPGPLFPTSGIH